MNEAELSTILYYADFLSLQKTSTPVTDSCKYFFVHGVPMNIAFIAGVSPIYDAKNPYLQRAIDEYTLLKDKFGDEGVMSFIGEICSLASGGAVGALQMLKYIHQYSEKGQRSRAFKKYKEYKQQYKYTYNRINEDGDLEELGCTKYVAHQNEANRLLKGPQLHQSL